MTKTAQGHYRDNRVESRFMDEPDRSVRKTTARLLDEFDDANRGKVLEARRSAQQCRVEAIERLHAVSSTEQRVYDAEVGKGKRADCRSPIRRRDSAQLAIVQRLFVWGDIVCTIRDEPPDRSVGARVLYRLFEQRTSPESQNAKNLTRRDREIEMMQDRVPEHQIDRAIGQRQAVRRADGERNPVDTVHPDSPNCQANELRGNVQCQDAGAAPREVERMHARSASKIQHPAAGNFADKRVQEFERIRSAGRWIQITGKILLTIDDFLLGRVECFGSAALRLGPLPFRQR